ncbi:MAG: hypothetical protein IJZ72_08035 [Oscillospiraceae bacterium]|nr:hypothetical protein [Oscillospiraceae bacterium]
MKFYFNYVPKWIFFISVFLQGILTCVPLLWAKGNTTWCIVFFPVWAVVIINKNISIYKNYLPKYDEPKMCSTIYAIKLIFAGLLIGIAGFIVSFIFVFMVLLAVSSPSLPG